MMRSAVSVLALAVPLLVQGAPVRRAANPTDVLVLQFAGVLEQLETQFYTQALAKFQDSDFTAAGFSDVQVPIQQFTAIQSDEATHLSTINSTLESLGASPISGCQFDFSSALTSVSVMAATARVVENLGVSAYLGAANMISDPVLLTAAASIMTVEARHQTVLNLLNDATSIPQAFDIALSPSQVLAVASPFISGCTIPIPANPTLTVTNTAPPAPGTALTFASSALNSSTDGLFCQMMVGGAAFSISLPFNNCVVPDGINGPVAIYITSDDQPIDNNIKEENTNTIVAGPTMAFIDADTDALAQLAVSGTASSSSNTTSSGSSASGSSASSSSSSVEPGNSSAASSVPPSASSAAATSLVTSNASDSSATASASAITTTISPSQASAIISAASADSASAAPTASPATAGSSTGTSSTDVVAFAGGPNLYTGPSADGNIDVLGWSTSTAS